MRGARREWLIVVLVVVVVFALTTAVIKIIGGAQPVAGHASAAGGDAVVPPAGTELINSDSGLSYRLPVTNWRPEPTIGAVGTITLNNGALRSPYECGSGYDARGQLGSGRAAVADPALLARSVASQAAAQFYSETLPTGPLTPTVTAGTTTTTQRRLPNGQVVSGAIATAFATQKTDPCLAARGEVAVLVLRLSDRDAVLVVNGDLSGGPAHPAPPAQGELMGIIDSAELVG